MSQPWPPADLLLLTIVLGLVAGSFLSMLVARLPRMLAAAARAEALADLGRPAAPAAPARRFDLAWPGSHCPACERPLAWWHNLPLVGFLALRGRCGHCGVRIAWRYPALELLATGLCVVALWRFGADLRLPLAACFGLALLALAAIDLETMLLPDVIVLPLLWLGLLANAFDSFVPAADAVLGAAAGYVALWSIDRAYRLLRHREAMGGGDMKLLAALGAWLGPLALPPVLGLAALLGAVVGLGLLAAGRRSLASALPFGPMLAFAGWLALLAGRPGLDAFYRWLGT